MPEGGTLTIETENVLFDADYCRTHAWAKPGRYVLMSVTDTGIGMEKDVLDHVFEPFYTTKSVGKGTGLGLATVYGIVKQHDGFINVYSEPGRGTTFKVYLPVTERRVSEVGPKIEGPVTGGSETILLAEDDEAVRRLARKILERAGYTVIEAKDGEEAVARFREHADRVELLLLDVVMPGLGGQDVMERAAEIRPGVPVVFASGYSENAVHTNVVLRARIRLIQKPFGHDALLRAVRGALDEPRA
jgi:CheY-like chemotaxis protein